MVARLRVAVISLVLVACEGGCRRDDRRVSADAAAGTTALDVIPFRERAQVPAIAWAGVRRDTTTSGASGLADVAHETPATDRTPFEAASIAKTVIATCVLQLVEEGKLSLDADVSIWLGRTLAHPRDVAPVTLRFLLTHTSALVDDDASGAPGDVALADVLSRRLSFADAGVGSAMRYSNTGASLAALVVERVAGRPFAEHARQRVFGPLRMEATFRRPASTPAFPHALAGGAFRPLALPSHALYPVVDLFASAADLARLARAILRGGELDGARILSPASVDAMLASSVDAAPDEGLGWQLRTIGGARVAGHEGEDAGASTALYVDRARGTAAVVLANGDAFASGDARRAQALGELVERLLR